MSLTDWHESEQRRLTYDYVAQQTRRAEHRARKTRRRAKRHEFYRWIDLSKQVVSDVGRYR